QGRQQGLLPYAVDGQRRAALADVECEHLLAGHRETSSPHYDLDGTLECPEALRPRARRSELHRGERPQVTVLDHIHHRVMVSCQAYGDEPLNEPEIMAAMARSVVRGGACAI